MTLKNKYKVIFFYHNIKVKRMVYISDWKVWGV